MMRVPMKHNNLKINSITSFALQIVTVLQGLIIPRLILITFGSDVNGLVSSINQFLNFFSVLEGGISGVILAALYKPLVKNDKELLSGIIVSATSFLKKLAYVFLIYSLILGVVYPFIKSDFSWLYTFSLIIIISITNFIQYFYAILPQLIVRADNRIHVYNITCIGFICINILMTIVCIRVLPEIHIVKLFSSLAFLIEPIILNKYVRKHYVIDKNATPNSNLIKSRWNGFGINIANVITTNTDVIVLTLLSTLKNVSIYTIYYAIANALKGIVLSFGFGFQSLTGQEIAKNEKEKLQHYFNEYEFTNYNISCILISCCSVLIVPFIEIYTNGISDANYSQPLFSFILCIAIFLLCIREPYIQLTYNAGLFKETQGYAYTEAVINVVISIILVKKMGLIGVAIGTAISAFYRFMVTIYFLKTHVLFRNVKKSIINFFIFFIPFFTLSLISLFNVNYLGIASWIVHSIFTLFIVIVIYFIVDCLFFRNYLVSALKKINVFSKLKN